MLHTIPEAGAQDNYYTKESSSSEKVKSLKINASEEGLIKYIWLKPIYPREPPTLEGRFLSLDQIAGCKLHPLSL